MTESTIQRNIKLYLTRQGFEVFRINVGKFKLNDGRWFSTGAPVGFSDLFAIKEGKAYFFEVKTAKGKASREQLNFLDQMRKKGCMAEIVRSVEDVEKIIKAID